MGFHTFDPAMADRLDDPARFRYCSREELAVALETSSESVIADLGSGTGLYTEAVSPLVGQLYAVDVQPEMHDRYRENGVAENVSLVSADVRSLPFGDGDLDGAFSTMTFHEFGDEDALAEVHRVLADDAPVVITDWSANGTGEAGPPLDERYTALDARSMLEGVGFDVLTCTERPETLFVTARASP